MSDTDKLTPLSEMTRAETAEAMNAEGTRETSQSDAEVLLKDISVNEGVFQSRDDFNDWEQQSHIKGLVACIKAKRKLVPLEPFTVAPVQGAFVLLDGHMRLKAYRLAGWPDDRPIPVTILKAPFSECLKFSIEANTRDKLPLTNEQKQEAAWRMLTHSAQVTENNSQPLYSQRVVSGSSGVSLGVVNKQFQLLAALREWKGDAALELTYREALRMERGEGEPIEPDEMRDKRVKVWANRIGKAFGKTLAKEADIFTEALRYYSETAYERVFEAMVFDDPSRAEEMAQEADNPDF